MNRLLFNSQKPHWLVLPFSSGVLLALAFYPFELWPLIFVAFAPLIYFAIAMPGRSMREVFIGAFIAGSISSLSFSYPFFAQFHWAKDTYLFTAMVQLLYIPATIIGGLAAGIITVATRFLLTKFSVFNALIWSTLFASWLLFFQLSIDGFNYFDPAFVVASLPWLVKFAGLAGTPLVAFIILLINSFFALLFIYENKKGFLLGAAGVAVIFSLSLIAHEKYLNRGGNEVGAKTVSVAIAQISARKDNAFGDVVNGSFQYPLLAERLREASRKGAKLIIYPFSPVSGAIAVNGMKDAFNKKVLIADTASFGGWIEKQISPDAVALTWNSLYENGSFFNENSYWQNGVLKERYQKRHLLAFADYSPQWAAQKGLYTGPFDVKAGYMHEPVRLGEYSVGNLICSEVGDRALARSDAKNSSFIIAAGSDAMFLGDIAGKINLVNAQYRAAENNISVIRANRLGPSAFIRPDGSIEARMEYNTDGVLLGDTSLGKRKETFYSRFGDIPLFIVFGLITLLAVVLKIKALLRPKVA